MDITIGTHELAAAWPKLSKEVQQAIYIAVMEGRLLAKDLEVDALRHQVEVLEEAIRMPDGFSRAPTNEAADALAARPMINEV